MSADENKAAYSRLIDALNIADFGVLDRLVDELFTDSYVYHYMAQPPEVRSHEFMKNMFHDGLKADPHMHFAIEDMIAEENGLAVRVMQTHTDPSTGKLGHAELIGIRRMTDGKFSETWDFWTPVAS